MLESRFQACLSRVDLIRTFSLGVFPLASFLNHVDEMLTYQTNCLITFTELSSSDYLDRRRNAKKTKIEGSKRPIAIALLELLDLIIVVYG